MNTSTKFDMFGFTVYADAFVVSEGMVEDLELMIEGCELSEVDTETLEAMEEEAKELLVYNVYGDELTG